MDKYTVEVGGVEYEINEAIAILVDIKNRSKSPEEKADLDKDIKKLVAYKNKHNIKRQSYLTATKVVLRQRGLVKI